MCCKWNSAPRAIPSAIVISLCPLLFEHPPQGCANKTVLLLSTPTPPPPPDSARRQSIQRRRRKVVIWGREKVLIREARAKKLWACPAFLPLSPSVAPFFRVPGGGRTVGCIFVLLCAHFMLRSPAERGYAAWSERPCWNAYNALWKLWLLLI